MRPLQAREIAYVGLFAALTAVGAVFSIQINAVPFSLQLLFTLLSGAVLGSRLGALSQASYVLMGLIGLPVFAMRRSGFGVLFGPTGGFIVGFIIAAWLTGWIIERGLTTRPNQNQVTTIVVVAFAMLLGSLVTYVPGIAWLSWHVGGIRPAMTSMVPFIPVDLIKAGLGTALVVLLRARGISFLVAQSVSKGA